MLKDIQCALLCLWVPILKLILDFGFFFFFLNASHWYANTLANYYTILANSCKALWTFSSTAIFILPHLHPRYWLDLRIWVFFSFFFSFLMWHKIMLASIIMSVFIALLTRSTFLCLKQKRTRLKQCHILVNKLWFITDCKSSLSAREPEQAPVSNTVR